jgi:hypothetical protein
MANTERIEEMGDRANIYVVDDTDTTHGIYLYTHWRGHEWPEALRKALDTPVARDRWNDPQYLTRIIVTELFRDLDGSSTGGGISTWIGDNSYPVVCLDVATGCVGFAPEGNEKDSSKWRDVHNFSVFVENGPAQYPEY